MMNDDANPQNQTDQTLKHQGVDPDEMDEKDRQRLADDMAAEGDGETDTDDKDEDGAKEDGATAVQ